MDLQKWYNLTVTQQLGNIGSEINRARGFEKKNDKEARDRCILRALELVDLTLTDPKWHNRLSELTCFQEVVYDWFKETHIYQITPEELENYCIAFSLRG